MTIEIVGSSVFSIWRFLLYQANQSVSLIFTYGYINGVTKAGSMALSAADHDRHGFFPGNARNEISFTLIVSGKRSTHSLPLHVAMTSFVPILGPVHDQSGWHIHVSMSPSNAPVSERLHECIIPLSSHFILSICTFPRHPTQVPHELVQIVPAGALGSFRTIYLR